MRFTLFIKKVAASDYLKLGVVVAIAAAFFISGSVLSAYRDSESIGSVLCLSCIKLEPLTEIEFRFETVNGKEHPDFVTEALKRGPVLLDYSQDNCLGCENMHPYFDALDDKYGDRCKFIYINRDHTDTATRDSFEIYNIWGPQGGTPMWVMVTLGYDHEWETHEIAKPYFATAYGFLSEPGDSNPSPEKGAMRLEQLVLDGLTLYEQNS